MYLRILTLLLLPAFASAQSRSIHSLIDITPRYQFPYCTEYPADEIEKFNTYYPKNKVMATIEDTTAIENNLVYAEILDRDAQLRLDSSLVRNHLLKPGERLQNESGADFYAYFADAFVIDINAFYGIIIEKVMIREGKLTSEKFFCTLNRDGKLLDKVSILRSPSPTSKDHVKACIRSAAAIDLLDSNGSAKTLTIGPSGKIESN